jgi:hypothetical protein
MKFNILNQSIIVRKLILSALFLLIFIPLASATPSLTIISPENKTYNQFEIPITFYSNETVNVRFELIIIKFNSTVEWEEKNITFLNKKIALNEGEYLLKITASNENGSSYAEIRFTQTKVGLDVPVTDCDYLVNATYILTQDLWDRTGICMQIIGDFASLDCQGHTIDGTLEFMTIGVLMRRTGNGLYHCNIREWHHGVYISPFQKWLLYIDISGNNIFMNRYGITIDNKENETSAGYFEDNKIYWNDIGLYFYNVTYPFEMNRIRNNLFNNTVNTYFAMGIGANEWNTTKTLKQNIVGGRYVGGNYWGKPDLTGFSDTCPDADKDDICDTTYTVIGNNIDYLPLAKPTLRPDLVVTDIYTVGGRIYYKIKNQGTAPAGSSVSELKVDGVVKETRTIGGLAVGEEREESFTYAWTCSGDYDVITVTADSTNVIEEINEGNNEYYEYWACAFDFDVTVYPTSATVKQGENATASVSVTYKSGTYATVGLSCENLPTGTSCIFQPSAGVPTFSSTLTITTSSTTPVGTYTITIKGSSDAVSKTTTFTLTVSPPIKFVVTRIIPPKPPIYVDRTYKFYICAKNMGTEERKVRIGFTAFADVTGLTNNTVYTTYPSYSWKKMCNGYREKFDDICYVSAYTEDRDKNKWPDIRNITPGGEICVDIDYKFTSESPANFDVGDRITFFSGIWDDETGEFYSAYALVDVFTLEEEPLYACPISLTASHRVARIGDVVTYTAYIHNTKTTWNFTVYLGIGKWNATHGVEYPEPQPILMPPCNLECYKDTYGETYLSLIIPKDFTVPVTRKLKIPEYFPKGLSIDVAVGVYRTKVLEEKTKTLEGKKPVCFVYFKDVTNISTEPSIVETLGESARRGIDSALEITSRAMFPEAPEPVASSLAKFIISGLLIAIFSAVISIKSENWKAGVILALVLLGVACYAGWMPWIIFFVVLIFSLVIFARSLAEIFAGR